MLQKLKATSLLNAILICLLISILCSGILLASNYNMLFQNRQLQKDNIILANESAINLMLFSSEDKQNKEIKTSIFDDGIVSEMRTMPWGFYKVLQSKSYFNTDTIQKTMLIGHPVQSKTALYVTDHDRVLNVSGNIKVKGDIEVPKGVIENRHVFGGASNINVIGKKKKSEKRLPELRKNIFNVTELETEVLSLGELLKGKDEYINDFDKPTQKLQVEGNLNDRLHLKGNIILEAKGTLKIESSWKLEDVIVKAQKVIVESNFSGNIQIVAEKEVIVEDKVTLKYPSSILINQPQDSARITIGERSKILGGIVLNNTNYKNSLKASVIVEKEAQVLGDIYCFGALELKGSVYGTVYADKVLTKTKGSVYVNLLMNAEIDNSKLPDNFVRMPLFEEQNQNQQYYEIIKKL